MNLAKPLAVASIVLGLVSTTALAAETSVLTIAQPGFGQSPVLAWSWGAVNSGGGSSGGGGGAGKVSFQDLSLTRATDAQSPKFLETVAKGTHLPIVILQDGALKITLKDVLISSYQTGDSSERKTVPTENISLNYSKIRYEVGGVGFGWDIPANVPE